MKKGFWDYPKEDSAKFGYASSRLYYKDEHEFWSRRREDISKFLLL
jgi:hypothetical protein